MDASSVLRPALGANAIFSGSCGLVLLIAPGSAAGWMGGGPPLIYALLGLGLVAFALAPAVLATRPHPVRRWVGLVTASDLAWVFATLGILAGPGWGRLADQGARILLVVAACVLLLAVLQMIGLSRTGPTPRGARP